jgi:hypothetical protein
MRLGVLDVDKMLRRLTAKQFRGWVQYAELEPFQFDTELRDDYRIAAVAQVIANVNRGEKQRAFTVEDFRLKFDEEKKETSPEETRRLHLLWIRSIAQAHAHTEA